MAIFAQETSTRRFKLLVYKAREDEVCVGGGGRRVTISLQMPGHFHFVSFPEGDGEGGGGVSGDWGGGFNHQFKHINCNIPLPLGKLQHTENGKKVLHPT